jgi:hypothetical protein
LEEFQHSRIQALALTAIHKQPFPLSHYCGICAFQNVASAAQTNDSLMGHGHNNRIDDPEILSEMTATCA